jgi:hypothetical protein
VAAKKQRSEAARMAAAEAAENTREVRKQLSAAWTSVDKIARRVKLGQNGVREILSALVAQGHALDRLSPDRTAIEVRSVQRNKTRPVHAPRLTTIPEGAASKAACGSIDVLCILAKAIEDITCSTCLKLMAKRPQMRTALRNAGLERATA